MSNIRQVFLLQSLRVKNERIEWNSMSTLPDIQSKVSIHLTKTNYLIFNIDVKTRNYSSSILETLAYSIISFMYS